MRQQVILGIGQGAVIALILARPRLCEIALKNKVVQEAELRSTGLAAAWQGTQAVIVAMPYIFKGRTKMEMWKEALPEILVASPGGVEAPLDCFTMGWTHVHQSFEVELVELLGVLRESRGRKRFVWIPF